MTASNTSNSFTALFRRSLLIGLALIAPTLALANPSSYVLDIYNQAAQGNEDLVEVAYERLNDTLQQDGATPLTLVYLGSTETLMGRDVLLPWNKMKYVEKGLSTIDKSLVLLKDEDQPIHEQPRVQGLPDSYLTRAMAAVTYTSLPGMFNHFDRGYDLFLSLLAEDEFQQQHFSATSWIYRYAITASIRAEDLTQAQAWLKQMEMANADNIETMTAKALIAKAK